MTITRDEVKQAAAEGIEYIDPPPPDYRGMLVNMYHILRGVQVALQNPGMIPEQYRELVLKGAVDGQVQYLIESIAPQENTVEVVLQAIGIRRAVKQRAA